MNNRKTFWKLIQENKIEVPIIQRDYAQGRKEDKVNSIRKEFVTNLLKALADNNESIHLGFIYGKIEGKDRYVELERNKRAIENILNAVEGYAQQLDMKINTEIKPIVKENTKNINLPTFIPLDGQQRLTTLFLLHWYLIVFSESNDKEYNLKTLGNFTYKIRKSSLEFCDALCNYDNIQKLNPANTSISKLIENKKWFRKIWIKDSTVKGMLVMLDEIHNQFSVGDHKVDYLEKLINEHPPIITFDFLDLNELNQTDELYVKMNARGKQLSEFEHFKAWLQNYVSTHKSENTKEDQERIHLSNLIEEKNWKYNIDRIWLDLFWKNKEPGIYHVDNVIYNAFKQISLFEYIATKGKSVDEEVTKIIRENSYIPFSYYEVHNFFNEKSINFLFNSLNALSDKNLISQYEEWLSDITTEAFFGSKLNLTKFFLQNDKTIDRPESVFFYSFLLFIENTSNKNSEHSFKNWMRFTRNIIFNTYIQNPENYIDAITALRGLSNHINDLSEYLCNKAPKERVPFFGETIKQESLKAKLIESNSEWYKPIINLENHHYLRGDIEFILEMSKIDTEYSPQKFIEYAECIAALFLDPIRTHPQRILQRALLTVGDYLPKVGANYLIPLPNRDSLRARRDNWQRVFKHPENIKYILSLCEIIKNNTAHIESKLNKLIDDYSEKDWRFFFVKSSETIDFCSKGFIRFNSEDDILLLRTSKAYGRHAELRSYYGYCRLNLEDTTPFLNKKYWENRMGQYQFPCIQFLDWKLDEQTYRLEITFQSNGTYLIQIVNQEKLELSQKITTLLKSNGWELLSNSYQCSKNFSDIGELKSFLSLTLKKLSTII